MCSTEVGGSGSDEAFQSPPRMRSRVQAHGGLLFGIPLLFGRPGEHVSYLHVLLRRHVPDAEFLVFGMWSSSAFVIGPFGEPGKR